MPRSPRLLLSQSYYHIMARGNNKNMVFKDEDDYRYYLRLIKKYKKELPFDLFHYCLMPTHIHMLIRTQRAKDFSLFMKKINLAYFYFYMRKYIWVGHFWQGRFKSQPVGKDEYFIQCGKYIELNPVRKKMVEDPGDYRYSSYSYYALGQKDELITNDIFYTELGSNSDKRKQKYQELVIDDFIASSYLKKIWGSNKQRYMESQKIQRKFS